MAFGDSGNLNTGTIVKPREGFGARTRPAPAKNPLIKRASILDMAKNIPGGVEAANAVEPRSQSVMNGIDTMLSKTRFSSVRSFYDTQGSVFNFNPNQVADLISAGVFAYGKTGKEGYPTPTVGVNVNALDQFLRDNYKQKGTGAYVPTRRATKQGLALSDTFKIKAAGSVAGFDLGRRDLNPSSSASIFKNAPTKNTVTGKEYDYNSMAQSYVKDTNAYAEYQSKIIKKIAKEGGSALLQQISENGATPESIAKLQEYMYSPRGTYGKAQAKWIDQTFFGGAQAEVQNKAARAAADMDQRTYLYEERVKERAELEKQNQKEIDNANTLYFNTDPTKGAVTPTSAYLNNAMSLIVSGTGEYVSTSALNEIFYSDVQKGTYKNLSDSQKQAVYSGVFSAISNGLYVPPFMYQRAVEFEKELGEKGQLPDQVKALEDARQQANAGYFSSPVTKALGSVPGIGPALVGTGFIGGITANDVNQSLTAKGPLASTPLKDGFSLADLGVNALKSVTRSTISMPQGIYYGAIDPTETAKAYATDLKTRYGSTEGFTTSAYEDPLAPILDVLSVISFAGAGLKAAQVARVMAATKGARFATAAGKIDMGAYNTHIDDYLNTPSNLRNPDDLKPPSAFVEPPIQIGAREYARLARQAALGDEGAALSLGLFLPDSSLGLNSAYVPTVMDRAAAFFEPRYRIMTQQEGAPKRRTAVSDETLSVLEQTVPTTPRVARVRFAGNPLSRGIQKATFYTQRQIARTPGKVPQVLANLPGGYSFRFTRALREGDPAVLDMHAREMIYNRMFNEDFKSLDMNDAEQLAVMNYASGEMYSPTNLRTIAYKRTARARKEGLDPSEDGVIGMAEADYKLFSDPSFVREYERAHNEMHTNSAGPRTERGEQLVAAAERMILLREKTSHLINYSWDDSRASRAMQLRYQIAMEAADLMPATVFEELGKKLNRIVRMNPVYHLYEINRMDVMDLPDERGVALRDVEGVDATDVRAIADQVEAALEYLRSDLSNRTKGGVPLLHIVEEVPNLVGDRDFVIARRIRLDGYTNLETGIVSRNSLDDAQELLLPKEFFTTVTKGKRKGRIAYWDNKRADKFGFTGAQRRVNDLILNEMEALFPNARDFTDKVASESLGVRESFATKKNFNKAVASGLLSFRYQEQVNAHASAVNRRFNEDIKTLIDSQSEIIAIEDFDKNQHIPLRTARVYPTRMQAEDKLRASNSADSTIEEVTNSDGSKAYVVNLNYFDVTAATLKEMRLKRTLNWDDEVATNYFDTIENLKIENPNQAIVVVPKYFAENVGKSYKRSQKLGAKILAMSTDMFKVFTLSLNPRFVPQQIIGSAVMLMLAYPEKAPGIMSKVFEYSARQAHTKIAKVTNNESAEFLNHNTDFMVMEQYMPRDITENIYQQDMLSTAGKKLPSKAMRYILNSGYLIAFAWERNLRVAIGRKMAMQYPGFETFAKTKVVRDYAEGAGTIPGMAPSMFTTNSPFAAAFKLLADPESPYYDPMFLREVRHGTDMVSGNYRDFTDTERMLRNILMPFYAWTRHSALFTKRMVQERPLTTNALAWVGNYGYDKTFENGGLPEWLLESLPMPQFIENILDLNPLNDNRLNIGGVLPFGTFGQTIAAGSNFAFGRRFGSSQTTDFINPFFKTAIEQRTNKSLLTGEALDNRGYPAMVADGFQGFPVIGAVVNLFKNESQLNVLRGRENPEDVFVDVNDPNSKLSIPKDKLTTKFETDSPAGLFNLFSPLRAYSLDPAGLDNTINNEYRDAGLRVPSKSSPEYRGIFEVINSLQRWKRKRDFIMNVYSPAFEASNPELVQRAQQQLAAEFPQVPASTPPGLVEKVLNGYVTVPGGE